MIVIDNNQMRVLFDHDHETAMPGRSGDDAGGQAATPGGQAVMLVGRSGGGAGQVVTPVRG
jgi:hypothetical protein